MINALSFGLGLLFSAGLAIAGMTDPKKVLAFLDVTGRWDPSLAFVMAGAIVSYAIGLRALRSRTRPLFAARFDQPASRPIDGALLAGAALFGVGWGLVGLCPGPALVGIATLAPDRLLFVAAMVLGMAAHARFRRAGEEATR